MHGNAHLLVIGPTALATAIADALPQCKSVATDSLLKGIWTIGHDEFDGVVISVSLGQRVHTAIRSLREVAPDTRIVVTCPPQEEPSAREILDAGADDYVLEPLTRADLEAAFQIASVPPCAVPDKPVPSVEEIVHLSEVLKNLHTGAQATLDRLATLLQSAFDAEGITIQVDGLVASAGRSEQPVLQEPIHRQDTIVGGIALGRRRQGTYAAGDAARLTDYAHLIETVIAQVRERAHWQELAWRDDLSGLHNRRYFDATLDDLIARAMLQRQRLTVLLFDIDGFKSYNDSYGHETGDALIREVATLLTHCSREPDIVARYGGDEFAVIMWDAEKPRVPGSRHPSDPMALADRFRATIHAHDFKCLGPDAPGPVTISGGLACFPWDGKTRDEIMRAADEALLDAKRTGKNRIALANGTSTQQEDTRGLSA